MSEANRLYQNARRSVPGILFALLISFMIPGCGGGDKAGTTASSSTGTTAPSSTMPPPSTSTKYADLNPTNAGYAATALGRAADARPRPGSITQSSNVNNGITVDRVAVTAQHGATRNNYSVRNGSSWSISTSDGNPVSIPGIPAPLKGSELTKRVNGGTLYVDVYSDIGAPSTREVSTSGGTPVRLEDSEGSTISGLTLDEINARMGDGELDGVQGIFSCDRAGGGTCPAIFGFPTVDFSGTDWIFTPHGSTRTETTPDADYLAGGIWLFVPDGATSADDVVFGAFGDGSDPFRQGNLMALQGTARYVGAAAGVYSARSSSGSELGYLGGDVTLTADFGGRSDLGTISGSVTGIEVDDQRFSGSLSLGTASIGSSDSGFFEGRVSGVVEGRAYTGRWGGQFFGNGEADGKPGSVGGTLGGRSTDDTVNFVGIIGAYRQ